MVLKEQKEYQKLIETNRTTIDLLKAKVEAQYPDIKLGTLNDGTIVDDLFYLRYILSSKDKLTSNAEIEDSKTLSNIYHAIDVRNTKLCHQPSSAALSIASVLPMEKSGELFNGTPVIFLPLKMVDFDRLAAKQVEDDVIEFLLQMRSRLFNELDRKTRETGKIVKSVTIYDLNGLSFGDIYKLKGFFKIIQSQGKQFKRIFPQCTELTVFVNVTASYLLKSLMTSSKQKIMTQKELHAKLNCRDAVPSLIGGNVQWKRPEIVCEAAPQILDICEAVEPIYEGKNKKIGLNALEKEMVLLKKNKIFSINVLRARQNVDLYFTNFKQKEANVLIIIKQKETTERQRVTLPVGFSTVPLKLSSTGEIVIAYLDSKKSSKYASKAVLLEDVNLKRGPVKKLLRNGRKKLRKFGKKGFVESLEVLRQQNELLKSGIKSKDKVLFRFQVSDFVVCGSEASVTDAELESLISENDEEELIDYECLSLGSNDSACPSATAGTFFSAATQIIGQGILW